MAGHSKEANSPQGCISYANRLIQLFGLNFPRISSIQDINDSFFIGLFEYATGYSIPDLLLGTDQTTTIHNIQSVIDALSLDIFGLSLSHISGEDIVSGNINSIVNLLEIFEALFLQLSSNNGRKAKDTSENSYPDINSKSDFSEKAKLSSDDSDKNIPAPRPLKRKTCKKTLQKSVSQNRPGLEKKISEDLTVPSHSKWFSDTVDNCQPPLKRKKSKPVSTTTKQPSTEGVEELYDSNFEMKLRAILQSDKSPTARAQQLKRKYIQSLRTSPKRTRLPPCKKSFLLPHDLRRKTKSPDRKTLSKRKSSFKRSDRLYISKNNKNRTDENIPETIQSVLEEFPGFHFPKNIQELLIKRYYEHLYLMHKQLKSALLKKPTTLVQTEKAMEDEVKLSKLLAKDLQEKNYLKEFNEHKKLESRIKCSLRDARLQSAKIKQYYNEFQKSMSKKLQKRNFSEELLVEKTFKEVLDLQKEKVHLLCKKIGETNEQDAKQHSRYLNALKNLYKEQLDLLAESINAEHRNSAMRDNAQKQATEKMYNELRITLQKEVRSLQKDVLDMIEDIHFRELDAQNFIESLQQQDS